MNGFFKTMTVVGALWLTATNAGAVDFRGAAWSGAGGQTSFAVGNVTASADCNSPSACDGIDALDPGPFVLFQGAQGLGVTGVEFFEEADEIDRFPGNGLAEVLKVAFAAPVGLASILVTNLFDEEFLSIPYLEVGSYSLDGGVSWTDFFATDEPPDNPNGELLIDLGGAVTDQVWFRVPDGHLQSILSEFSVAAITPVPEPATLLLLGSGLVGLGGIARRRLKDWNGA